MKSLLLLFSLLLTPANAKRCQVEFGSAYDNFPTWLTSEPSKEALPKTCIENSMNAFSSWAGSLGHRNDGSEGTFIYCSEEGSTKSPYPMCHTPSYLNVTTNTYHAITDCLDINKEELYPIIATESGFYHNSLSHIEGDFGLGQVTDPVIGDVNNTWYSHIEALKESPKKSCRRLLKFIEEYELKPVEDDFRCSLTSAPKNPVLNALYTGFHYKMIKGYTEDFSKNHFLQTRVETLLGRNFTLKTFEKIKSVMTILSYNMGHIGTTMAMDEFLKQQLDFLSQFKKERQDISTQIALINFQLKAKKEFNDGLIKKKATLIKELEEQDWKIAWLRDPARFNGDNTPYSFGEFLTKRNLSHYLKVLTRRVEYLSRFDRDKICPTTDFLHIF
ncbi:MAG: hypothetical protein VXV96_05965 [Bdellovibrionota bacterium]|nr:hypothetical protein [Bdellovibrionota bacterium]